MKKFTENPPIYPTPIPNRYNPYGEWRPLFYPGNSDELERQLRDKLASNKDYKIHGCMQYMLATGLPVIEFIVKSNFVFPYPDNGVNHEFGHLHMRKIDVVNLENNTAANLQVYDCTMEVPEISVEAIQNGLDLINTLLYRLTYGLNSKYELIIKYPGIKSVDGVTELSDEDMALAIEYVTKFKGEDSMILDRVISSYQEGNRLRLTNTLLSFLSYYLALEMLALTLQSGEMEASKRYGFTPLTKEEKRLQTNQCILELEKTSPLKDDPEAFTRKAYEDCILGNYRKTKVALAAVFGKDHNLVASFTNKIKYQGEDFTLYTLRNQIAHGKITPAEESRIDEIIKELPSISDITRKFINRILWGVEPKDITRSMRLSMIIADPRSCGITNDIRMIASNNWKIRIEWLY